MREMGRYRNIEQHAPLKCVKAFGVFTDSSDPGRFLLVLENLNLVEGNERELWRRVLSPCSAWICSAHACALAPPTACPCLVFLPFALSLPLEHPVFLKLSTICLVL